MCMCVYLVCAWVSMHVPYSFFGNLRTTLWSWIYGLELRSSNFWGKYLPRKLSPVKYLADHHHNSPMGPHFGEWENQLPQIFLWLSCGTLMWAYTHSKEMNLLKKNHPFDKHHISVPWKRYTVLCGLQWRFNFCDV